MKICLNKKLGGRALMVIGLLYLAAAMVLRQPAFSGVGGALIVIGVVLSRKNTGDGAA